MAYDQAMARRIRAALADIQSLDEKSMFGSFGFMVRGKLSVCVRQDNVMYKIGRACAETAVAAAQAEPVIMRGNVMKDWVYIPNASLHEKHEFDNWLNLALAHNKKVTTHA